MVMRPPLQIQSMWTGTGTRLIQISRLRARFFDMRADKRDNNEHEIMAVFHSVGWASIKMKPGQGCDYVVISPRGIMIVEIKNPEYAWKLTKSEAALRDECERLGETYHVLEYADDALELLGIDG